MLGLSWNLGILGEKLKMACVNEPLFHLSKNLWPLKEKFPQKSCPISFNSYFRGICIHASHGTKDIRHAGWPEAEWGWVWLGFTVESSPKLYLLIFFYPSIFDSRCQPVYSFAVQLKENTSHSGMALACHLTLGEFTFPSLHLVCGV